MIVVVDNAAQRVEVVEVGEVGDGEKLPGNVADGDGNLRDDSTVDVLSQLVDEASAC